MQDILSQVLASQFREVDLVWASAELWAATRGLLLEALAVAEV